MKNAYLLIIFFYSCNNKLSTDYDIFASWHYNESVIVDYDSVFYIHNKKTNNIKINRNCNKLKFNICYLYNNDYLSITEYEDKTCFSVLDTIFNVKSMLELKNATYDNDHSINDLIIDSSNKKLYFTANPKDDIFPPLHFYLYKFDLLNYQLISIDTINFSPIFNRLCHIEAEFIDSKFLLINFIDHKDKAGAYLYDIQKKEIIIISKEYYCETMWYDDKFNKYTMFLNNGNIYEVNPPIIIYIANITKTKQLRYVTRFSNFGLFSYGTKAKIYNFISNEIHSLNLNIESHSKVSTYKNKLYVSTDKDGVVECTILYFDEITNEFHLSNRRKFVIDNHFYQLIDNNIYYVKNSELKVITID